MNSLRQPLVVAARAIGGAALLSLLLPAPPAFGQCDPSEVAKLVASDAGPGENFGASGAVAGDTAVVGAWFADAPGQDVAGAAYVFVRSGPPGNEVWTEQAKLNSSDPAANDQFGISVAVSGETAVVGAWLDDDGGSDTGSAYVFVRSGTVWTQQAKLTAFDAAANDNFGTSVALSGDTAVVGAPRNGSPGQSDEGAAYVFVRSGGIWTLQTKLIASSTQPNLKLGNAVAVLDDTAVIGAEADLGGSNVGKGAAFVFVRSGTLWTQQAKLTASDAAQGTPDNLGHSVALSGDTIVAGAWQHDLAVGNDHGAAYVFVEPSGGWANMTEAAKLTASDAATSDTFGVSVAVSGDTVLVGAHQDDHAGGNGAGSAYEFVKPPGGWVTMTETSKLTASDPGVNDNFGVSVALSGTTAVVGAYRDTNAAGAVSAGAAYVFGLCPPAVTYCTAGTSASGCQAALSASGTPSASAPSGFDLMAASVEGAKDGLFFFGTNGRQANPWGNGSSYQCVVPPVKRTGLVGGTGTSGQCNGSLSQDMNAHWTAFPAKNPGSGATVQAQLWYRDPLNTSNQSTSLSDAIEFVTGP